MENSRIPGEHFFTTSDNTALFYRHWPALQPGAKKVIVLFHRGHEHSGRLQHLVDELAMPDTAFYAWDARGHGKSSGPRGYSPSLARSVRDVDEFVRFSASDSQVGLEEVVVIAQSGSYNSSYVDQSRNNNLAYVQQVGGSGNSSTVIQH